MYIAIIYKLAQHCGFRFGLHAFAREVVCEALRRLEIGHGSGYKMHISSHILSSGAGLPAQLLFNA